MYTQKGKGAAAFLFSEIFFLLLDLEGELAVE